jgi:hypothetical protein
MVSINSRMFELQQLKKIYEELVKNQQDRAFLEER